MWRVIPVLLIRNGSLVKSVKFRNHRYVGDPVNVVSIFNQFNVDEIVILNIASQVPRLEEISELTSECLMPVTFGGGIWRLQDIHDLLRVGTEKVVINTAAHRTPIFVEEAAREFGSQCIVASIDVTSTSGRWRACTANGTEETEHDPVALARRFEDMGVGEILLTSIDRDGTMVGYDINLISKVSGAVSVPVIACGGAGKRSDLPTAVIDGGASAAAAGSLFLFQKKGMGVLVNFPTRAELESLFRAADQMSGRS